MVTGNMGLVPPQANRRRGESCGHRQHRRGPRVTTAIDRRKLAESRRKNAQMIHDETMHETMIVTWMIGTCWCIKRTRPDTRSGRAALTDAGVDGGARADRNYQA
jgi:hypothetical protein